MKWVDIWMDLRLGFNPLSISELTFGRLLGFGETSFGYMPGSQYFDPES